MLTKPLTFLLTFLLTVVNFIILLVPVAIVAFPLFMFLESLFVKIGANIFFFLVSRVSIFMIILLAMDFIFGFTVRRVNRNAIPFKKATNLYGHDDIMASFEWLKKKFKVSNVELYVDQSIAEINAYAVGSLRRKTVTITMGLLIKIKESSANHAQFVDAVRGILGHEMSHLANKDYLPGLMAYVNESANSKIATLLRWIFIIFANLFRFIPWIGRPIYNFIITIYNLVFFVIMFFFRYLFIPVYNFIRKGLSRSIEYRCDRESAYAFGGNSMANALSMIGEGSYFSIFSTHPRTKSRIANVKGITPRGGFITPSIINSLSNFLCLAFVVAVAVYSTQQADVPALYDHFLLEVYYPIQFKWLDLQNFIMELTYLYAR